MYNISRLFIYPVKSLAGIEVESSILTARGLQHDRSWMLVDKNNCFITQREYPLMSLLQTAIDGENLVIYHKDNVLNKLVMPLRPLPGNPVEVQVFDDRCTAQFTSDAADEWFSSSLSMCCKIVYMPESTNRKVDTKYAHRDEITSFTDGYPLMIIGQSSLDDLNRRLYYPLPVDRFRPNLVFTGGEAYEEDTMAHIRVGDIDLYGVKLCARCVITTIDQATAEKGLEPLKTLAGYRAKNNKVYFGQNMLFDQTGYLKSGQAIEVIKRKPSIFS